jgi:hypothetical protein
MGTWYSVTDANGNTANVTNAEKYATYREDQIRAEQGMPLREFYAPDTSGAGYGPSRILVPGTNQNRFIRSPALGSPVQHLNITPASPSHPIIK